MTRGGGIVAFVDLSLREAASLFQLLLSLLPLLKICESGALIRDLTHKGVARLAYGSGRGGQPLPGFSEHLGERRERSGRLVEVALPLLHVPEICGAFAAGAQCILERRHGRTHGLRHTG